MANPLLDKLKKNSSIKLTAQMSKSTIFNKKDMITTLLPALNIAFSGEIDGGFLSGLTVWAGASKTAKTVFALVMAKSYLDKYPDAVLLFYDCEFGAPQGYFESMGIDIDRVIHVPFTNVEELKIDMVKQYEGLNRGDKVITIIDSLGNVPSMKELEDAKEGKTVADMSRAKAINSLIRMITPYLTIKDLPVVAIAKVYKEQSLFPKDIVAGGNGIMYGADNLYILGKQQEKDGKDLEGYNFIINVEKSRFCTEKSKIPIQLLFDGGFTKYSGLLDIALELGKVVKPSNGYYSRVDADGVVEDKKWRAKATNSSEFWNQLLNDESFKSLVANKYRVSSGKMFNEETVSVDLEDAEDL